MTDIRTAHLLKEAGMSLEKLASKNEALSKELAEKNHLIECIKLASEMPEEMRRGEDPYEYGVKLAKSGEDLTVLRKALELQLPSPKLAYQGEGVPSIDDIDLGMTRVPDGQGKAFFEAWLQSGR